MVELGVDLSHDHISDVPFHSISHKETVGHASLIDRHLLPVFPYLLPQVATTTVGGKGIVAIGRHTHLHEMVAATDGSDAVVEHVFAHVDALEESRDTLLRHIHVADHLRPLLSGFCKSYLQMLI